MYIKIIGEDTHYHVLLEPFTTQHGKNAVRFIGDEIPTTNKGFMLYNDDDVEIGDLSKYKYEYRQNEYSEEQDTQELPRWTDAPIKPSAVDKLNTKVNRINSQVNYITPYEETKKAYYGEKEKTFYNVPNGKVSVFFDNYNNEYLTKRIGNRFIVLFSEKLEKTTNVTVMVQN